MFSLYNWTSYFILCSTSQVVFWTVLRQNKDDQLKINSMTNHLINWNYYIIPYNRDYHLIIYISVMVPTLQTIMNSSYYHEYRENIHLDVKFSPTEHYGNQTDVQHSFTYSVFILSFNILVLHNPGFVSFFQTFYWSTTIGDIISLRSLFYIIYNSYLL